MNCLMLYVACQPAGTLTSESRPQTTARHCLEQLAPSEPLSVSVRTPYSWGQRGQALV